MISFFLLLSLVMPTKCHVSHLAVLDARGGITPKCPNLLWLHPPKTSSTLCTTISHICCPKLFSFGVKTFVESNYTTNKLSRGCTVPLDFKQNGFACVGLGCNGEHFPYPTEDKDNKRIFNNQTTIIAVTMMRQPALRLISSFFDGGGHWEGFNDKLHTNMLKKWETYPQEEPDQIKQTTIRKALEYIYHPHMIGCVTKMLLGYPCYSDYLSKQSSFNVTALHVAKQRLRQFFFVGIFEHYEESIRLFHRIANVSTQPHWTELKKQRFTVIDPEIRAILLANVSTSFVDPYDDELYAQAKEWFLKTNKTYHTV